MSMLPGSFRPDEIADAARSGSETDLTGALTAARILEQAIPSDDLRPSVGFTSRVMAAVASEPPPRAAGFLGGMLAQPGLRSLVASVGQAWATAWRGAGRPLGARAAALAYVLVVLLAAASIAGGAAIGTAGAIGLFSSNGSPTPPIVAPSPSPVLPNGVVPTGSPAPSPSDPPAASASPDSSPASTKKPSATPLPGGGQVPLPPGAGGVPSPTPSDDAHASYSPKPSRSPKPSETP